jgi:hypothetical protein
MEPLNGPSMNFPISWSPISNVSFPLPTVALDPLAPHERHGHDHKAFVITIGVGIAAGAARLAKRKGLLKLNLECVKRVAAFLTMSAGLNCNMLPFIFAPPHHESLPAEYRKYAPMIEACFAPRSFLRFPPQYPSFQSGKLLGEEDDDLRDCKAEESGKVCYLTIQESNVEAGQSQRRSGLHIEAGGAECGGAHSSHIFWGGGKGRREDRRSGGLYMASSVADTCAIFDALVDKSKAKAHGDIEHLRPLLVDEYQPVQLQISNDVRRTALRNPDLDDKPSVYWKKLDAGQLVWLTDRTPHESLPLVTGTHRQYFRLVTHNISHWYEEHSTANPRVPLPGAVKLVKGNKFEAPAKRKRCSVRLQQQAQKEDAKLSAAAKRKRKSD